MNWKYPFNGAVSSTPRHLLPLFPFSLLLVPILFLSLSYHGVEASSAVSSANVDQTVSFPLYPFFYGSHLTSSSNFSASIVPLSHSILCSTYQVSTENITGKAVYSFWGGCDPATKAASVARMGGVALISDVDETLPGFNSYWWHDPSSDNLPVYCYGVPSHQIQPLDSLMRRWNASETVQIDLSPSLNPWQEIVEGGGWILFQLVMSLASIANLAIAGERFWVIGNVRGFKLSIPLFCLSMEILCNVLRLVVVAVDPVASRLLFPRAANYILFTITQPLNMITTIILVFFFHELTSSSKLVQVSFLANTWTKASACVISFVLIFLDLYTSVTRLETDFKESNGISLFVLYNVIIMMLNIIIATLFIRSTWKVRKLLLKSTATGKQGDTNKNKGVNNLTKNVFISAILLLCEVFFRFMAVLNIDPWGWFFFIFFGTASSIGKSTFQILAFGAQKNKKSVKLKSSSIDGTGTRDSTSTDKMRKSFQMNRPSALSGAGSTIAGSPSPTSASPITPASGRRKYQRKRDSNRSSTVCSPGATTLAVPSSASSFTPRSVPSSPVLFSSGSGSGVEPVNSPSPLKPFSYTAGNSTTPTPPSISLGKQNKSAPKTFIPPPLPPSYLAKLQKEKEEKEENGVNGGRGRRREDDEEEEEEKRNGVKHIGLNIPSISLQHLSPYTPNNTSPLATPSSPGTARSVDSNTRLLSSDIASPMSPMSPPLPSSARSHIV